MITGPVLSGSHATLIHDIPLYVFKCYEEDQNYGKQQGIFKISADFVEFRCGKRAKKKRKNIIQVRCRN